MQGHSLVMNGGGYIPTDAENGNVAVTIGREQKGRTLEAALGRES